MTLTQLRCFIEVAEELSFSKVSKKLFISQTAVTYHIMALERELGVSLFARSTRKVALTEVGRQFYKDISQPVAAIDTAYENVRAASSQQVFVIGYSALCFGDCFRRIVSRFSEKYPDTNILLSNTEPETDLLERLLNNDLNVALFLNPFTSLPEDISIRRFGNVPHMLIVSETHRLAERPFIMSSEIPQYELRAHEGIKQLEEMNSSAFSRTSENESRRSIPPKNLDSLLSMVCAGLCVARLPILDRIDRTGLRCLPMVDDKGMEHGPMLTVAWRTTRISPMTEEFCTIVQEEQRRIVPRYN